MNVLFFMFDFNSHVSLISFFLSKAGLVHKYIVDVTVCAYFQNLLLLFFYINELFLVDLH